MAARKIKPVDETAVTAEDVAVTEPVKSDEGAAEAEPVKAAAQTVASPDEASAQALAFPYNRTLKFGADGEDVKAIQSVLLTAGLDVPLSGVYDQRTVRAVQQLQRQKGMPASGIIGKNDYAALLSAE